MSKRLVNNQRGAALIETAITIPIILLISVAIFEFGRAYQTWQVVTNASREGARIAVIAGTSDDDITNAVRSYMTNGALSNAGIAQININRTAPLTIGNGSQITVNYPFDFIVLNPVIRLVKSNSNTGSGTLTMQAVAIMRNEG